MGKHRYGSHSTNEPTINKQQKMANFSVALILNHVNSQSTNQPTEKSRCLFGNIFINCLIYKLQCDMKFAWLSSASNAFNQKSISIIPDSIQCTPLDSWQAVGIEMDFWWFSCAIASDALSALCGMCVFVMKIYISCCFRRKSIAI